MYLFSVIGGGFGRRASDGGANLEMYFHRQGDGNWSQPGSNQHMQLVRNLKNNNNPTSDFVFLVATR